MHRGAEWMCSAYTQTEQQASLFSQLHKAAWGSELTKATAFHTDVESRQGDKPEAERKQEDK